MILISKENIDGCDVKYYDGIDFDMINTHPRDGSSVSSYSLLIVLYQKLISTIEQKK